MPRYIVTLYRKVGAWAEIEVDAANYAEAEIEASFHDPDLLDWEVVVQDSKALPVEVVEVETIEGRE